MAQSEERSAERVRLLRPSAVAERLDISRASVYRLIQHGALPALRVGSQLRVPVDGLNKYLESQRVNGWLKLDS